MDRLQAAILELEKVERQIFAALARSPIRDLHESRARGELKALFKRSLGVDLISKPVINSGVLRQIDLPGCSLQLLHGESWPQCPLSAHLFLPDTAPPWPVVLVCCGHGAGGKFEYNAMGLRLARQGAAALIPDNLGQGERQPMGHRDLTAPFDCGFSVQALIVQETLAWIEWLKKDSRFTRIAAAGNSGGGLLTMCLAALSDDLQAIASSGYPSSFELIARKQKRHCHCNLIPGCIGRYEMWEIYSLFAPKPLLLMQGENDILFSCDSFLACARRVRDVYKQFQAEDNYASRLEPGMHSWDENRRSVIGEFFARHLSLRQPEPEDEAQLELSGPALASCLPNWPADAIDAEALALRLAGKSPRPSRKLWEIYAPELDCPMPPVSERGDTEQILAQMKCFMADLA